MEKIYICIDLKSFYASVECRERKLDPLQTNLVVADSSRTDKTVCLAVTPSLKAYGIGGRDRLYSVKQKVAKINAERKKKIYKFKGKSVDDKQIKKDKTLEVDFIIAKPRMALYMKYSAYIYKIYLKYISPEDIFPYSIDEVFCDITHYIKTYKMTPKQLVTKMIKEVYEKTGITATAGIGTNLFLCKVAMDVGAKKVKPNEFGVRIAYLDEKRYREKLWNHKPITDIWRVGSGIAKKLEKYNIFTMGDIALISLKNEDLLYKLFGVNAEFLIDHAWGYEPVTIKDVKNYKPQNKSLSSGQVLHVPYDYKKARIVVSEMADNISLDLVDKNLVTNQIILTIGYDTKNIDSNYKGEITTDYYGRKIPKHSHSTINISHHTSSSRIIVQKTLELYDKIINKNLSIRRITVVCNNIKNKEETQEKISKQYNLFTDILKEDEKIKEELKKEKEDEKIQKTLLNIKNKYGKNSILKGINYVDGATAKDRNKQIGGHHE